METALIEVLLNGNVGNTVTKRVTAAEVAILKNIHGEDAVTNAADISKSSRSNAEEVDRLRQFYGKKAVDAVFPGAMPTLPTSLAAVGIEVAAERQPRKQKVD